MDVMDVSAADAITDLVRCARCSMVTVDVYEYFIPLIYYQIYAIPA